MKQSSPLRASRIFSGVCLAFASTFSVATPIAGQFFPGELNQLSDNNAEYLVNKNGSLSGSGDSKLDEGDRLVGIFNIESIEGLISGGTNNLALSGRELTGVFDVKVAQKLFNPITGFYTFLFSATNASGVAVSVYDGSSINYTRLDDGTDGNLSTDRQDRIDALIGNASDGLGFFDMTINQYWVANTTTDDILALAAIPPSQAINTFLVSGNIVNNNSGLTFDKVDCGVTPAGLLAFHQTDICGSGSLLGIGPATTPFDSFSNVDFAVNVVPEPSSLALAGLALLGIGAAARSRRG